MSKLTENADLLPYRVGGLLYTPALSSGIAEKIIAHSMPCLSSLAFCLEDAIMDEAVTAAERQLLQTLDAIQQAEIDNQPLLFVRVRNPQHLAHVHATLGSLSSSLTGYIFPKFDLYNAEQYLDQLALINAGGGKKFYGMPILESASICRIETRAETLAKLKGSIDFQRDFVLNIRVGGNDLCALFGIRRSVEQTIYDAGVIRDALIDIMNAFGRDYVVSAPVWEYYEQSPNNGLWKLGLSRELALDALNGFVGKTAIHPSQLPVIYEALSVSRSDYEDARSILDWQIRDMAVAGSSSGRMNELKCHVKWASKILSLAKVYGIKDGDEL